MKAAIANASTMLPSSHCSAERHDFKVWLRIIGSIVRPLPGPLRR
jgi:hypothetical protein